MEKPNGGRDTRRLAPHTPSCKVRKDLRNGSSQVGLGDDGGPVRGESFELAGAQASRLTAEEIRFRPIMLRLHPLSIFGVPLERVKACCRAARRCARPGRDQAQARSCFGSSAFLRYELTFRLNPGS